MTSRLEDVDESRVVVEREAGLAARLRSLRAAGLADRSPQQPEGQVRCHRGVDVAAGWRFNTTIFCLSFGL